MKKIKTHSSDYNHALQLRIHHKYGINPPDIESALTSYIKAVARAPHLAEKLYKRLVKLNERLGIYKIKEYKDGFEEIDRITKIFSDLLMDLCAKLGRRPCWVEMVEYQKQLEKSSNPDHQMVAHYLSCSWGLPLAAAYFWRHQDAKDCSICGKRHHLENYEDMVDWIMFRCPAIK
jgi:hypothetical protein